jgi:hypothetical protein
MIAIVHLWYPRSPKEVLDGTLSTGPLAAAAAVERDKSAQIPDAALLRSLDVIDKATTIDVLEASPALTKSSERGEGVASSNFSAG